MPTRAPAVYASHHCAHTALAANHSHGTPPPLLLRLLHLVLLFHRHRLRRPPTRGNPKTSDDRLASPRLACHGVQVDQLGQLLAYVALRLIPASLSAITPAAHRAHRAHRVHRAHRAHADYLGPNRTPGSPPAIHVRDVRLTLIAALGFSFQGKRCLDVGCNDGSVGTQLGR